MKCRSSSVLERQSQGKFGLWPNSLEISFLYLENYLLISLALPNVDCSIYLKCVVCGFFQSMCVCIYFKIEANIEQMNSPFLEKLFKFCTKLRRGWWSSLHMGTGGTHWPHFLKVNL